MAIYSDVFTPKKDAPKAPEPVVEETVAEEQPKPKRKAKAKKKIEKDA